MSAELQSISWANYGNLALQNSPHFWPDVKREWRNHHISAISHAIKAREHWLKNRDIMAVKELEKALILASFSDHFLHDAFSIGHSGFSRINSLQNPSLIFHDDWNRKGRWMMGNRFVRVKGVPHKVQSCDEVFDTKKQVVVKKENVDCGLDIWVAYGDDYLDAESKSRIVNAAINSTLSIVIRFLEGDSGVYSHAAYQQFPISTQSFSKDAVFFSGFGQRDDFYRIDMPSGQSCSGEESSVYLLYNICWFALENSYMEPVYPNVSIALSIYSFKGYGAKGRAMYLAYSPYHSDYQSLFKWPKNMRLYTLLDLDNIDIMYEGTHVDAYREAGLSILLPNFYHGTPISHEINIAYAIMIRDKNNYDWNVKPVQEGGYLGLNTHFDFLTIQFSIGLGVFVTDSNFTDIETKGQIMVGWNFGSLGGGPLSRWYE